MLRVTNGILEVTMELFIGGKKEAGIKQQVGAVSLKIEKEGEKSNLWFGRKKKIVFQYF